MLHTEIWSDHHHSVWNDMKKQNKLTVSIQKNCGNVSKMLQETYLQNKNLTGLLQLMAKLMFGNVNWYFPLTLQLQIYIYIYIYIYTVPWKGFCPLAVFFIFIFCIFVTLKRFRSSKKCLYYTKIMQANTKCSF